jgi:arylsulfatase A-like enzyme/Flp pilus assembly protein TadD
VIVTIDTLRADHVGAYGRADAATPFLDSLARDGAMARQASAHVPLTRPSHVSIFTGRLPTETAIRDNISPAVVPAVPLLAEVLKKAGFTTGAFVSSVVLDPSSGLDRGFDTYSAEFEGGAEEAQFLNTVQKKGDRTTAEAIAWLEKSAPASGRLFLWLHLYDPHDPYEPPEPYASRFRDRPYDGEVAFADSLVKRLDDSLGRLGLRGDTALVVTSDHGEGLGDHGESLHGFFAYQSTLAVPFLVRGPGVRAGTQVSAVVRLVDVFPTALDLVAVPVPGDAHPAGRSLAPELRGQTALPEPVVYAESLVPLLHFGWSDLRVIREGRWKYIQAPHPELYDLSADPGERKNLAAEPDQGSRTQAMAAALGKVLDAERAALRDSRSAPAVSPELLEKLGALGYVGGRAAAETAAPGADPKDMLPDFRIANDGIREGLLRLHAKDYAASAARFQSVLARGISSFEIHFYLARALFGLKRYAEAARHFEEAAKRAPAHGPAWEGLAQSLAAAGQTDRALEALARGQKALPQGASLRAQEAGLLRNLGRREDARRVYETAIAIAPRSARLRSDLGELLRDMGRIDDAVRRQQEATELEPTVALYWNSLGMTLGGNGRPAEAERAFREAVRLNDKSHRYAYNLGLILVRQGRGDEARPWLETALRLDPSFAPAREQLREIATGPRSSSK